MGDRGQAARAPAGGGRALMEQGGDGAATPLLQPHNLEAEESVLGAMMVSEAAIDPVVIEIRLSPEDFYRGRHGAIYEAISELYGRSEPVDALTVAELLRSRGKLDEVGGREAISGLAASTPVPGNAGHYARIVKQNAMLRRLLGASQRIQQSVQAREGEPEDLVEQAEKLLFNVARAEQAGDFSSLSDILDQETDRLEKLASGETTLTGTPSGFPQLDEMTGGFQPGNLIVLAARPAMGKSSFVCNIAENVATKGGMPVAFFSLEMSETELAHRFIASRANISNDRLRKGQVTKDWDRVLRACNELSEAPLWIDDSSDLGLLDLRAKARRLHSSAGGLGLVIVDYIQLMRSDDPRAGRVEQVGQMSRGLKILARELSVPVIGISQLSRAPEQRPDKVPILSDLRESGCLTGDTRVHLPDSGGWATMADLASAGRSAAVRVLALNEATMRLEAAAVSNAFSTGEKQVFRLRTRLGRTIRATANHRFRTISGWRRLDELSLGDHLALPSSLPPSRAEAQSDELQLLAESDVYWDPVLSVEADGVEEVFDLTVDGHHNFVADDIVVHNSIEQDADIVSFIYRDEYYNEDSERQGEADLVIAKHRNGPIGTVPMAFQAQYPRFLPLSPRERAERDALEQYA